MKKVLFLVTKSSWGGAGRYVFDLSINLPKDGYESVVALGGTGPLYLRLKEAGIRTISLSSLQRDVNPLLDITAFFALIKLLRSERPDIIHLNSSKIGGLGALAGRLVGIPKIVFTVHGWAFLENRNVLVRYIIRFFSWITVLLSHIVITVSENDNEKTPRLFFYHKKIVTIHNGISPTAFLSQKEAREILTQKCRVPEAKANTTWIGTISELHANKGLHDMIEALALLKEHTNRFVWFVIGEGEGRQNLELRIEERGLHNHVFLCGFVSHASNYLSAFDLFTLSSLKEGLPYAILEAGNAELPVLATDVGGIPEIIDHGINGVLVSPGDFNAISQALERLITTPKERERLGIQLKEKIKQEFDLREMISKTLSLYNK